MVFHDSNAFCTWMSAEKYSRLEVIRSLFSKDKILFFFLSVNIKYIPVFRHLEEKSVLFSLVVSQ